MAPVRSKLFGNRLVHATLMRIELPAIVHRVEAGHRLRLVLASTDAAYKNAYAVQPVTVRASPAAPATLSIPVVP